MRQRIVRQNKNGERVRAEQNAAARIIRELQRGGKVRIAQHRIAKNSVSGDAKKTGIRRSRRIYQVVGGLSYSANLRIVAPHSNAPCQCWRYADFTVFAYMQSVFREVVQMKTTKDTRENSTTQSQLSIAPKVGKTTATRSEFNLTGDVFLVSFR